MSTTLPYRKLIAIFVLFFSNLLMAADPLSYADDASRTPLLDYFPVIVFSETGAFANMFQFVAGVAQEFSLGGDLFWIGAVGMGVAIVAGVYRSFLRYSISGSVKEVLFPVAAAILLVMPSQSVTIFDGRTAMSTDVRVVDNVPWFIATTASMTSVATAKLMYIVDDTSAAIGTTTDFRYGAQGLGAPEEFALKAIQKAKLDSNTSTALNRVVKECLIPNSIDATFFNYIGEHTDANDKFNAYDAMREIGNNSAVANTNMEGNETCQAYISAHFSTTVENAENARIEKEVLGHLNFLEKEKLAALTAAFLGLTDNKNFSDSSSETLSSFIGYLKNYQFNGALAGSIQNARAEALGGGDSIAIVTETTAKATMGNLQVSGLGNWRAMGELVPLAHSYLLALIYAASILMGIVVLWYGYEKGLGVMKEFFIGLVTFEFVKVAFVLANNNVLFHAQENAIGLLAGDGTSGVTMNNPASIPYIAQHLEYVANMSGMAGALGLAAMLFIPGIVFGGKVAAAMGILGNAGGMVQNKNPQSAVEDIAKEKGRQKDLDKIASDARMREELERAGIHVGANSDVGAVYSEYTAGMDRAAQNLATTSMYKDYDSRYAGVQGQTIQSSAGLIGAGKESQHYNYDQMVSAGEATGASSFSGQMAQGQGLINSGNADNEGNLNSEYRFGQLANATTAASAVTAQGKGMKDAGAIDNNGILSEDYKFGQEVNAAVQARQIVATGREAKKTEGMIDKIAEQDAEDEISKYTTEAKDHTAAAKSFLEKAKNTKDKKEKNEFANKAKIEENQSAEALQNAEQAKGKLSEIQKSAIPKTGLEAMMFNADLSAQSNIQQARGLANQFGYDAENGTARIRNKDRNAEKAIEDEISSHAENLQKHSDRAKQLEEQAQNESGKEKSKDLQEAKGERIKASAENKALGQAIGRLEDAQKLPDYKTASVSDVLKAEGEKTAQSRIGSAIGAMDNINRSPDIYARNAMMSEMSQAQSAMQKIAAFGSVEGAVAADALGARKSAEQFKNDMRAFSDTMGKGDDLLKAMQQGGTEAAKKISDAMRGFGDIAYQTAHQGYQGQIGTAKGYVEERAKYGDDYQSKIAETSTKTQAEQGMQSIKGIQDYAGLSQGAAINALANQAGRTSYVQAQSTAQDMKLKDQAFGAKGFEEAGLTIARKQTDEAIGATRGIKYELKKRGDKGFQDVAQSGVESQVESGLGAIRGARGIHNLAWQGGVKSESDSNALRASIQQAGGEKAYIGLNEFVARKGITGMQSDRDGFNDTFGTDGYLGYKGFSAFRLAGAATSAKGYSEMKGTANAVGNVGLDVFEKNAQTEGTASPLSTKAKIEGAGGAQNYVTTSVISSNAQGAGMASEVAGSGGQVEHIQNAAYSSFQKGQQATKEREQDLYGKIAKINKATGLTETTDLGEIAIENSAVEKSVQKTKMAGDRGREATKLAAALDSPFADKAKTFQAIGIGEEAIADEGANMKAEDYRKIKLNSEKRMEKTEVNTYGSDGKITATTVRSVAGYQDDGTVDWHSEVENSSSLETRQSGRKNDLHLKDSLEATGKDAAAGVFGPEGAKLLGEGALATVVALGAAAGYDGFVKNYSSPGATAKLKNGNTAKMDSDHHWYEVNEKGEFIQNKDGGRTRMDGDLKPTAKKAWDTMFSRGDSDFGGKTTTKTMNGASDISNSGDNSKADNGIHSKTEHSDSLSKNTTGLSPSHTNNSTTNPQTKQEAVSSAKENLSKILSTPNSDFAKGELAMLVGQKEADLIEKHNSGQINDNDFKKQMSGINNLKSKISSGVDIGVADTQKAGITSKELSESGMSMKTVEANGGKKYQAIDMEKSGEVSKQVAVGHAKKSIESAERHLAEEVESSKQSGTANPDNSETNRPQKKSENLRQQKQALIEKQNADPRNPSMTKSDFKDAISDLDKAIDDAVKDEAKTEYKANRSQKRKEAREGRQASVFGDMAENIKNSSVGKMASNAIDGIGERYNAAREAAEHTHGGGKYGAIGKMSAFAGTLLAGTAMSSLFSSDAQAADMPVKVSPKPIMANEPINPPKDMLEKTSENLGTATLATGAVATMSGLDNKAGAFGKVAAKAFTPVAVAAGVVETASDVNKRLEKGDKEGAALEVVQGGLSAGGGWAGAATGAAVGTAILPGAGTVVGGIIGGVAGYLGGEKVGQIALDAHDNKNTAFSNAINPQKSNTSSNSKSDTPSSANIAQAGQAAPVSKEASEQVAPHNSIPVQKDQIGQGAIATGATQGAQKTVTTANSQATDVAVNGVSNKNNFVVSAGVDSGAKEDSTKTNTSVSGLSEVNEAKINSQANKDAGAMMEMMKGGFKSDFVKDQTVEPTITVKPKVVTDNTNTKNGEATPISTSSSTQTTPSSTATVAQTGQQSAQTSQGSAEQVKPTEQHQVTPSVAPINTSSSTQTTPSSTATVAQTGQQPAQTSQGSAEQVKPTEQHQVTTSQAKATESQKTSLDATAIQPIVDQLNNFASNQTRTQVGTEPTKVENWREVAPVTSGYTQGAQSAPQKPLAYINENSIAQNQQQEYANRTAYMENIRSGGGYQNIQRTANENPVNPAMMANNEQRDSQEKMMAIVSANNQSPSIPMTALDIQQTHQTRQLAQTQADYIKEVSRSMDEMVGTLSDLGGHFENFFAKAEGKVNDKA